MRASAAFLTAMTLLGSVARVGAEEVRVVSGEHSKFSRVVLTFAAPIEWSLRRDGQSARIALSRDGFDIDLSTVFSRIPRGRILSIRYEEAASAIDIETGCDCDIKLFSAGRNTLAIDVAGEPMSAIALRPRPRQSPSDPAPNTEPATKAQATVATAQNSGETDLSASETTSQPTPVTPQAAPTPVALPPLQPTRAAATPVELPKVRHVPLPDWSVVALEQQLLRQLARAASDDVLTLSPDGNGPQLQVGPTGPANPNEPEIPPQVNIETIFDRSLNALRPGSDADDPRCLASENFAFSYHSDDANPSGRIAVARTALFDDLGTLQQAGVVELAEVYLSLGFGTEVVALLDGFGIDSDQSEFFRDVAHILDDLPATPNALQGQLGCDGPAALWAVLAVADKAPLNGVNLSGVEQSFSAMSAHLRRLLGPKLIEKLQAAGHYDAAETVRNAAQRLPGEPAPALERLRAGQSTERGDLAGAESILTGLTEHNNEVTSVALADLLRNRLDSGAPVTSDMITLAEAYLFEDRGSDVADRFRFLIPWAMASRGNLLEAFDFMSHNPIQNTNQTSDALMDRLFGLLSTKIADGAFAETVFRLGLHGETAMLSPDTAAAFASRLSSLKFFTQAKEALDPFHQSRNSAIRLARASLALETGDPSLALALIAGQEGEEFAALRNEAELRLTGIAARSPQPSSDVKPANPTPDTRMAPNSSVGGTANTDIDPTDVVIADALTGAAVDVTPLPTTAQPRRVRSEPPTLRETAAQLDASRDLRARVQQILDAEITPEL